MTSCRCGSCGRMVDLVDYYELSDECVYCLFPEAGGSMPVLMDYSEGDAKPITSERWVLDNLDRIPEVQGRVASERRDNYKRQKGVYLRKFYK